MHVKQPGLHANEGVSRWQASNHQPIRHIHRQDYCLHEYHTAIACLLHVLRCDWRVVTFLSWLGNLCGGFSIAPS